MAEKLKKFVIQEHSSDSGVHWDLMLETGDILQTYRLDKLPSNTSCNKINAVKIFDHPLRFLTYQGPVNKGRGQVTISYAGTYQVTNQDCGLIELQLFGRTLNGTFTLTKISNDQWQFTKK